MPVSRRTFLGSGAIPAAGSSRAAAPFDPTPAAGITAVAMRPAATQLYLDWCLSEEGQTVLIRDLGHLTALRRAPLDPPGLDPEVQRLWFADRGESDRLRRPWLEDWGSLRGAAVAVRQPAR